MSTDPSVEQRIAAYLEGEAPSQVADRVLTATFDRTRATGQVSARRWRVNTMGPIPVTFTAAAAAFILLAGVGTALLVTRQTADQPLPGVTDLASICPATQPIARDPAAEPPLGVAIVCLDGSVGLDLGLPRDAWTPDLSPEGGRVAFRTDDLRTGVCHACPNHPYLTVVDIGSATGKFFIPIEGQPPFQNPSVFAWSPDGRRIAYQAEYDENVDIYVTELDVTDDYALAGVTTRLTTDPAFDEYPAWTPDGSTILYSNMGATGPDESGYSPTQEIWSIPAIGGTPTRLTDNVEADTEPDVGVDGTVAFWHAGETWTMNVDGSDQKPLGIDIGFSPRWSPDNSKLALLRYDPTERTTDDPEMPWPSLPLLEVVVIDLESREVTDVGPRVATDYNAVSWTLDGEGLLVNRYDDGS